MSKISACLIVFHEEAIIERCLKSLDGVVDEIIVVHDGPCHDRTLEIAQQYRAKTFEQPFGGSSECHRVFSYTQATSEWVLQIDADEYLSADLARELPTLAQAQDIDAYAFRWPAYNGREYFRGPFYLTPRPCFFRKSQMYFVAITHSFPRTYGRSLDRLDLLLEHNPKYNNNTFSKLFTKYFKWGRIQANQILHIYEADTYNVPDLRQTDDYRYYLKFVRHPFIRGVLQALRIQYRCLKYFIRHPGDILVVDNLKALVILSINLYYLSFEMAKLKLTHRQQTRELLQA